MEKNMNSWECDKLFASEASGPQKNLKMGLGGNLKFCGYGPPSLPARNLHGTDESFHPTRAPDAVVTPLSTSHVSEVMKICHSHRIPVIPFGTGTGS